MPDRPVSGRGPVRARVARVLNAVFEAGTAVAFIFVAVAFFATGGESLVRSPIGQTVAPYDFVWNVFYAAGGVATLAGLAAGERRVEVAGLVVLAWGLITNAVALIALNPAWRLGSYLAFAVACLVRVFLIVRR
jgi:hypothetical protein